ncbi:hypothetical protein [Halochromatium sp.]
MCNSRRASYPGLRASAESLRTLAGAQVCKLRAALRSVSSLADKGSVGLVPAVLGVALALALMLWALPEKNAGAQSALQSPLQPSRLTAVAER